MSTAPGKRAFDIAPPHPRGVAIALSGILALMTLDAVLRERGDLDYRLMRAIARVDFPGLGPVLRFASELTGSFWAIALWVCLVVAFLVTRRWLEATAMAAFPLVGGLNSLIRELVGRPRPEPWRTGLPRLSGEEFAGIGVANDFVSFPSGHVVGAVLLWGFLFILAGNLRPTILRRAARTACVLVIVASGFSRVWLAAHWTGDVLAAYALGGLALLVIGVMYRDLAPTVRGVPLVRAGWVPHDDSTPHAHALTSTILFRGDEVTKVYNPGFVPRLVYWISFQARFAYAHNPVALEAAVLRRNLAGRLTEYWFGTNAVAEALRVDVVDGRWAITGRFTDGVEPRDHQEARRFLFELADRFDRSGLPTWQIDPRQPRSLGNLLELPDGSYRIIDLESGLVSPLASPRAWWRAFRRGLVPFYDDVYFDLTRAYVEQEAASMARQRGEAWVNDLRDLVGRAEERTRAWHDSEPRLWGKTAHRVMTGFGVFGFRGWIGAKKAVGHNRAQRWLYASIDQWEAEGRVTGPDAAKLRLAVDSPEVQTVIPHFGVHLLIGVALRFPIGSITRVSYTTGNLLIACLRLATRRISHDEWRLAVGTHSPLVILIAAMPGIGTLSYLAARPVRSNHLLVRLVFDSAGEKLPFHVYRRLGLKRLIAGRGHGLQPTPTRDTATGSDAA